MDSLFRGYEDDSATMGEPFRDGSLNLNSGFLGAFSELPSLQGRFSAANEVLPVGKTSVRQSTGAIYRM